jgi:butyryl-CoA dehydrogenase
MNGGVAGVYVVIAKTDLTAGAKGFSAFVVDAAAAGLSVVRNIKNMGLRACQCAELKFDNVKIPTANLLSFEGGGMDLVKYVKAMANIAEGALAVGLAKAALTEASNYAKQRIQFKRPISSFPAMQTLMADIATNIHMARLAIYDAASLVEQDERFVVEAAMVKKFVSRIGTQALIDAIQVEGGVGFCEDMSAARLYRDVNGVLLSDSSEEFPEAVIAAEVLV